MKKECTCIAALWLASTGIGWSATSDHTESLMAVFGAWSPPYVVLQVSNDAFGDQILMVYGSLDGNSFYCYKFDSHWAIQIGQTRATLDVPAGDVPAMNCAPSPPFPNGFKVICDYDGHFVQYSDQNMTQFYDRRLSYKGKWSEVLRTASCVLSTSDGELFSTMASIDSAHVVTQ